MKLGTKLLMVPASVALVLVLAGQGEAWVQARATQQSHAQMEAQHQQQEGLHAASARLAQAHSDVYRTLGVIASLDDAAIRLAMQRLQTALQAVETDLQAQSTRPGVSAESAQLATHTTQLVKVYLKQAEAAMDMASVDANTGVAAMQTADRSFQQAIKAMAEVREKLGSDAASLTAATQARSGQLHWLLTGLSLLLASAAIAVSWRAQRGIVRDLARASQAAESIARGDLSVKVDSARDDEVGDLLRAIGRMTQGLEAALRTVQASTQAILEASGEIALGNANLSLRTEQTTGHLQQTTASLVDISGGVSQTAESSSSACAMARTASEVAQRGGQAVSHVVATMEDIQSSSRKIGDIIGTIDSIAFQTNILALNAAVEAARAGEQGRGFAVVAGEVRLLAKRSAEAAHEIKALIGTSVEKVENGSRQVRNAGATIDEVVQSAMRVAALIGDITAAATSQSAGISQVTGAVGELDRMTQENAVLVERSATAAGSLSQQVERLSDVVGGFRLSNEPAHA